MGDECMGCVLVWECGCMGDLSVWLCVSVGVWVIECMAVC